MLDFGYTHMLLIINMLTVCRISQLREENLQATDKRVKLTNELLQGIRAIKSYNWEAPFATQLAAIREAELHGLKSAANMRSLLVSTLSTAPSIVAVCTLATYALLGNELSPTKVFTSLALFNQLRFPLIFYPMLLNSLAEGRVSLKRLTQFFLTEEVQNYVETTDSQSSEGEETLQQQHTARRRAREVTVRITDGTFTWGSKCGDSDSRNGTHNRELWSLAAESTAKFDTVHNAGNVTIASNRDQLHNVNLSIRRGHLIAVIGPTGCGKSTLLHALLGELNKCAGCVMVKGRVAYVPQSTWIPNESLRNVILFGRPLEQSRYERVLNMCGLSRDLELLEAGDQTEIGERGVNLSGGQKQRVSVARAVYDDADVYLFDDPLSALDNSVGAKLFMDCIKRGLAGKTRILVTHQLGVLSQVDKVVLMDHSGEGGACRILDQGTLRELLRRGHDLTKYVTEKAPPEEATAGAGSAVTTADATASSVTVTALEPVALAGNATTSQVNENIVTSTVPPTGGLVEQAVPSDNSVPVTEPVISAAAIVHSAPQHVTKQPIIDVADASIEGAVNGATRAPTAGSYEVSTSSRADVMAPRVPVATSKPRRQLISKEDRAEGAVGTHVYHAYAAAANKPVLLALAVLSVLMSNVCLTWQQWIVAAWTSDTQYASHPLAVYLSGVTITALMVGTFNYLRTYFGVLFGVESSRTIHGRMIDRVLHAPLAFFGEFWRNTVCCGQHAPSVFTLVLEGIFELCSCMFHVCAVG
jgi:ABC-type multidrug transport system fused ATPase/permease subunit